MSIDQDVLERDAWLAAEYVVICEWVSPLFEGEFELRYRDQAKHQGPDNSVFGRVKSPGNVDIDHAYLVADRDWETAAGDEVGESLR